MPSSRNLLWLWFVCGSALAQPAPSAQPRTFELEIAASGDERAKLQDIVNELKTAFSAPGLWQDFVQVTQIYPRVYVGEDYAQTGQKPGYADAAGAADFLRSSASGFPTFRAFIGLTGTYYPKGDDYVGTCTDPSGHKIRCRATKIRQNYSNDLAVTQGVGSIQTGELEQVSIEIGREIFDRYNSTSLTRKSCTYNTVAHEWTHTIGRDQERHWSIVVDTNPPGVPSGTPKLSYLFGSVVQCRWLRDHAQILATPSALQACVEKFGADRFRSSQCQ